MNHPRLKPKDSDRITVTKKPPIREISTNNCEPLLMNLNRARLLSATYADTVDQISDNI